VINATLGGAGTLTLAGGTSDQFVDMPNGLVSSSTDLTIEIWLTWSGGNLWQRIFDFGNNTSGSEGAQGNGTSYLFLTPKAGTPERCLRLALTTNGISNETVVSGATALAINTLAHLTVVVDDTRDSLSLYLDGASLGTEPFTGHLSGIRDINNWLGRSQSVQDVELSGVLHELRFYRTALTTKQIELSHRAGPDPGFL
jgi:hypothetical protein